MGQLWRDFLTLCLLLTPQLATLSNSLCTPVDTRWMMYRLAPLPSDFGGQDSLDGTCSAMGTCVGPGFLGLPADRLANGVLGPQSLDDGTFVGYGWNQTISITFAFGTITTLVTGLNLYFYNIPSRRIGLPYDIRITSPASRNDHPYQLEGNNNLTPDDTGLQSVTLTPESLSIAPAMDTFTVVFDLSNTDEVDWLLLTEVEICTSSSGATLPNPPPPFTLIPDTVETISPPTVNSSFSLTCSVTEGRFAWTWTTPPTRAPLSPVRVLNAGRTSVLELSQLSSDNTGTYRCQAAYTFGSMVSNSTDISLSLQGFIKAENAMVVVTASDDIAVLRCFLYGYLPSGAVPSITWQVDNNEISNDSVNTITNEQGDLFIQNGGAQPIPSLTSTLTVNLTEAPLTANRRFYNCFSRQITIVSLQGIVLTTDNVVSPVTTTTPTTNPGPGELDLGLIIGVTTAGVVALLMIVIMVITVIIVVRRRHTHTDSDIPVQGNDAYELRPDTFNMMQNTIYSQVGPAEEGVYEDPDQMSHDYEEIGSALQSSISSDQEQILVYA